MKYLIKASAYTIGGLFLLTASFVLFATLSGTPLNEVAMIGDFVPDDEGGASAPTQDLDEIAEQLEQDKRSRTQILEAAASPLRSFVLESPFSASELESLEQRLQLRLDALDQRENALERRERELDESLRHVQGLYSELEELRNQVLAEKDEVDALQDEAEADAFAATEQQRAAYRAIASLFEEGKPATSAQMLIDGYEPHEVGQILSALDDTRVRELMQAVHKIDPDKFNAFEEAWRNAK